MTDGLPTLHAAAHAALTAALAASGPGGSAVPVFVNVPAGQGLAEPYPLPYVVLASDTAEADVLASDADGRLVAATKTVRVFASSDAAARSLGSACAAALADRADLAARVAPDGVAVLSAALDLHTTGPDNDPSGADGRALGSRVVRARYRLDVPA